ncbi:hypothetical protein U1Q18_024848 [Sarracenia purpurea var. burkii]
MVVVGVLKGSTAVLRNYAAGGGRPLFPTCFSLSCNYYHYQIPGNGNGFGKCKMTMGYSCKCTAAAAARRGVFCTAIQNVADSSSSLPETPSSPPASVVGGGDTEMATIKDVANTLDIRVGRILRAWRHEEADSLYVEEVDIGESQPRIICSGLVNYIPLDHLQDRGVVVLANLKARNMRGIKSHGMLMAASDASHENVELLVPPEGSPPGERIWFGSADEKENLPDAATANQVQKKKIWELVQPHLKTDTSCVAALGVHFMRTSAGLVVCTSLKNANIS